MDELRQVLGGRRGLLGIGGASAAAALAALATQGEAHADEAFNQQVASALGFWPVLTDDPPSVTTKYGVPVVWISRRATLVDTPTLPIVPRFDNATSSYTVPVSVGVDYVVGSTKKAAGTYASGPNTTVTITAVAQNGYIIPGVSQWRWSFPDPTKVTVVTSDGFSGADATTVVGRNADLVAGGTTATWKGYWEDPAAWGASGGKLVYRGLLGAVALPGGAGTNFRLEWDLVRFENVPHDSFVIAVAATASAGGGLMVSSGITGTRITTGSGHVVRTAPSFVPGRYAIQYYDRTATFETPVATYTADLSPYNASDQGTYGSTVMVRSSKADTAGAVGIEIDNVVLKKVGW